MIARVVLLGCALITTIAFIFGERHDPAWLVLAWLEVQEAVSRD